MDDTAWDAVERIVDRLDEESRLPGETDRLLRLMKLAEEVGEVTEAVIGVLGQNPRKGVTHQWEDVYAELSDVILTAMTALRSLTPDARRLFAERVEFVSRRLEAVDGQPEAPSIRSTRVP